MKISAVMIGLLMTSGANASPIAVNCHQQITQANYTGTGVALPVQHITAQVGYVINFDKRSLTVRSNGKSTTFLDGHGQHILIDHDGMTLAGTTQLGRDGPITSQIIHFSADGSRGNGERKLLLHGRLVQKADTTMICTMVK